jgi:hypothetical protein
MRGNGFWESTTVFRTPLYFLSCKIFLGLVFRSTAPQRNFNGSSTVVLFFYCCLIKP